MPSKEKRLPPNYPAIIACMIFSFLALHCGATQPVRVLDDGATKVSASLGGPFIPLGNTVVPIPYLTAGVQHGYTGSTTLTANAHLLTALFGDIGIDVGAARRILQEDELVPEVTAKAQMYFFDDVRRGNNPRFFPMLTVNASYRAGSSTLVYFGADNFFQFSTPSYFISPFVGTQFPLSRSVEMQVESKWMAANVNTAHGVFEGEGSVGGNGNIGLFVGFNYSLNSP